MDMTMGFGIKKTYFWVQIPSLTSHLTFLEPFISVKWGSGYPFLRTECVCTFDLLNTVPGTL